MRNLLIVLMIALAGTTYGQGHVYNGPQTFTGTLTVTGAAAFSGGMTNSGTTTNTGITANSGKTSFSGPFILTAETASTHNYTFLGGPVCAITTTRLDTINLVTANYFAGQRFSFYTATSANDSTKFISTTGTINGAASPYWMTGTYGAKSTTLYFDGTNYWILK